MPDDRDDDTLLWFDNSGSGPTKSTPMYCHGCDSTGIVFTLGARGGVPTWYITDTLQGNGQRTSQIPTQDIPSTFRIFPASFLAISPPVTFRFRRNPDVAGNGRSEDRKRVRLIAIDYRTVAGTAGAGCKGDRRSKGPDSWSPEWTPMALRRHKGGET